MTLILDAEGSFKMLQCVNPTPFQDASLETTWMELAEALRGLLGPRAFMHGPAGSVHTAAVQHCHPIAPVLDPPQAALLLSSSFCTFSAWQLGAEMRSLLPTVPKQY